jgi:hypothetical protein
MPASMYSRRRLSVVPVLAPVAVEAQVPAHLDVRGHQLTQAADAAGSPCDIPARCDHRIDPCSEGRLHGGERSGGPGVRRSMQGDARVRGDSPGPADHERPQLGRDGCPDIGQRRRQRPERLLQSSGAGVNPLADHLRQTVDVDPRPGITGRAGAAETQREQGPPPLVPAGELGLLVLARVLETHRAAGLQHDPGQGRGVQDGLYQRGAVLLDGLRRRAEPVEVGVAEGVADDEVRVPPA